MIDSLPEILSNSCHFTGIIADYHSKYYGQSGGLSGESPESCALAGSFSNKTIVVIDKAESPIRVIAAFREISILPLSSGPSVFFFFFIFSPLLKLHSYYK
jgi:hypothetical protein